jgi:hypothetical protein
MPGVVATALCRRAVSSQHASTERGDDSALKMDYFFTNRPRFSERNLGGRNSPSRRISFPSK